MTSHEDTNSNLRAGYLAKHSKLDGHSFDSEGIARPKNITNERRGYSAEYFTRGTMDRSIYA